MWSNAAAANLKDIPITIEAKAQSYPNKNGLRPAIKLADHLWEKKVFPDVRCPLFAPVAYLKPNY